MCARARGEGVPSISSLLQFSKFFGNGIRLNITSMDLSLSLFVIPSLTAFQAHGCVGFVQICELRGSCGCLM